jgi:hypothetical protein
MLKSNAERFEGKVQNIGLVFIGIVYGIILWNISGFPPIRWFMNQHLSDFEILYRWLCLPLCIFFGILSSFFVKKFFRNISWIKLLLISQIGFNFSYFVISIASELIINDGTFDIYWQIYYRLPVIVGVANAIVFCVSVIYWLILFGITKFFTSKSPLI